MAALEVSIDAVFAACEDPADVAALARMLDGGAAAGAQNDATGESALMRAASAANVDAVALLLERGAPWNALDRQGRCAGDYATDARSQECVDALVAAGVRAQLLFGLLETGASTEDRSTETYLGGVATFDATGETLTDESGDAVMMEWERPLMAAHADLMLGLFPHPACEPLAAREDLRVLNVGHGLGIVDGFIRRHADRLADHCIVEPHPDVLRRMDDWRAAERVTVRGETWQAALADPAFGPFDAIFFDTYAERYEDMRTFFKALPRLLTPGGVFSFFNGLAPFNPFFHGVACELVRTELAALGLECDFVPLKVEQMDDATWGGVRRRYWQFDVYSMPVASFAGAEAT
mmetsp:Transcript_34546/g.106168  ORF Transcript_34546/g.106168 Transcript_34546/m.106168 type:complete len:351 (+) Transcript_34546:517-1569(+)